MLFFYPVERTRSPGGGLDQTGNSYQSYLLSLSLELLLFNPKWIFFVFQVSDCSADTTGRQLPCLPLVGWWKPEEALTGELDPASLSLDDTKGYFGYDWRGTRQNVYMWWHREHLGRGEVGVSHNMHFCVGLILMQHVTAQNVTHSTFKF